MGSFKYCANCAGGFWAGHGGMKYCSDECRLVVKRRVCAEKARQAYQLSKHEIKSYRRCADAIEKENKRPKPAKSILEINTEARKEGLTYGQYVAKYGLN